MSSLRNWGRREKLVLHRFRPLGVMLSAALEHICASEPENVCTLLAASPNKLARRSSEPAASRSNLRMTDNQVFQALPRLTNHSQSTSFMRVCQSAPVPLKYATTFITHGTGLLAGRAVAHASLEPSDWHRPRLRGGTGSIPQNNSLCDPVRTNTSSPVSSEPCRS